MTRATEGEEDLKTVRPTNCLFLAYYLSCVGTNPFASISKYVHEKETLVEQYLEQAKENNASPVSPCLCACACARMCICVCVGEVCVHVSHTVICLLFFFNIVDPYC